MAKKDDDNSNNNVVERVVHSKLYDNLQSAGIILAMLMGMGQRPAPGSPEEKRIPDWVWSFIPEQFSIEDEVWTNLIKSSCTNPDAVKVERLFREKISNDPERFDIGKYRVMLMEMRKEYLEQSRKPVVKNEDNTRLVFETTTFRDPCNTFFAELVDESNRGGSAKKIYERQKKIALDSHLLIRMSTPKKIGLWVSRNKMKTLALAIAIPTIFVCFFLTIIFSII
ncbi:MAG: hypothetical protein RBS77_02410 [Candidatus Moranbacteria bacterium]|jgi:hypothetical protein|nr:hypothetical protein [Candidatus Moranbacteria bacterium]